MEKSEFLSRFAEIVMEEDPSGVVPAAPLNSFPGWDSMAQLSTIAFLDELGVTLRSGALQGCQTVQDVLSLAGDKVTG